MTAGIPGEVALRRGLLALLLLLFLGLAGAACRAPQASAGSILVHTFETPEAAAAGMTEALARSDREALRALAVTEQEFRTVVWPELPSSRPEMNLPVAYAWGTLHQTSQGALAATLGSHGGRRYTVVRVDFAGASTRYRTFTVHRESRVVVRDERGVERRLALFGSMLERDGRFKIFSYVVD